MMRIIDIWNEQENDKSEIGFLLRRCPASVLPDVFIGLRKDEQQKCIAIRLNKDKSIDLSIYSNLKDIKPEFRSDTKDSSKIYLLIILLNSQHTDVFATLCEDLISRVTEMNDQGKVVKELLNRLEKWKSLFDKAYEDGLSKEEQRGLYGELYFLRKWINNSGNFALCIKSWVGPEKAIRDFQISDWALEVKTTHGNNHQKVQINSERQLDTTNLHSLFLLHLSLEVQQKNGETLNQITDHVIELLSNDIASQSKFKAKLLEAGYFNTHRTYYENVGYQIRGENFYNVNNHFPRIEENDIRNGVGDVKYSIILAEYTEYLIEETNLLEKINSYGKP